MFDQDDKSPVTAGNSCNAIRRSAGIIEPQSETSPEISGSLLKRMSTSAEGWELFEIPQCETSPVAPVQSEMSILDIDISDGSS